VPIYLRSIAKIRDSFQEKTSETAIDGKPGVMVMVQKSPGANTIQVSDRVKSALKNIQKELPEGVKVTTIMDSSIFIRTSVKQTEKEALEGAFFAIIVILLFLRSVSSTLIVSTAIPISLITAFILMYFSKMTLNIVTLGGLALGVGRLVDDAIVVIESIFRHRVKTSDREVAAVEGTTEVSLAVLSSTITTVIVFAPMLFVTGIAGIMFKPMAYTVVISLAASYFVAMVLIPLLSSKFMKSVPDENENVPAGGGIWAGLKSGVWQKSVEVFYNKILKWALGHRRKTVYIVLACFVLTLPMVVFIGTEFIPASDQGEFTISVNLPVGTKLEKTLDVVNKLEHKIKESVPEVKTIYTQTGVEGKGFAALRSIFSNMTGSHSSQFRVELVDSNKRKRSTQEIIEALRTKLADTPDAEVRFQESGSMMGSFMGSDPIVVEIRGFDFNISRKLAEEVVRIGKTIPGMREMKINREEGLPELQVVINREKASSLGLSVAQIGNTIQSNIDGATASLFRDEELGKEFYVTARLQESDRAASPDLGNVFITSPLGKQVALSNVARIMKGTGPIKIDRKNQERIVTVTAQIFGVPPGTVAASLERNIRKEMVIPDNFTVTVAGSYKDQGDAFKNLLFALLLAVALVYMVMAAQFESLLDPFIIMFSVPLGIIGVIWALFLTGHTLSVISFIGIIMMSGIVVSNAILLVDYTNTLRGRGMELEEAVKAAGHTRLRPVLMTTLTTVVAMTPVALGIGEGGEMIAPMAVSVVGGLIISTVLTLVFIPTLYMIVEKRIKKSA
jgi:hydrophobic/amphiphilic exporter-1 (mainly G- bacteria), HAE1 family